MTRPQYKPRPQYRGVPRLRRGAPSVWGRGAPRLRRGATSGWRSRCATASPGRDERLEVEARHGFAGARRAVGGRGAPRLRRGATSGWGSRRATASPGRDERLGVEARHGFAGARRAVGGRGAPRLRRGATSGWGVWGAISGPPILLVVAAVLPVARGAVGDAGARSDELPVDEDVVHDREADAVRVLRRGRIGALVVEERDAHDRAAGRNGRKLLSRREASPRPFDRILGRGRLDTVGAPADEVGGVRARRRLDHDVEARRAGAAMPAVTKIEAERERGVHAHLRHSGDACAGGGAVGAGAVLRQQQAAVRILGRVRDAVERGVTAVVRQPHAAEPRRRHDVASEGARATVVGLADEHEGDRPELLSGGFHGTERADHEDHRDDENAADVTDLHVCPPWRPDQGLFAARRARSWRSASRVTSSAFVTAMIVSCTVPPTKSRSLVRPFQVTWSPL